MQGIDPKNAAVNMQGKQGIGLGDQGNLKCSRKDQSELTSDI